MTQKLKSKRLLLPEDIEVHYIIPTIKRYLSVYMKQNKKSQKEIADILGIKSAAVSQYISKKRGNQITFDKDLLAEIKKSAKMINNRLSFFREMRRLLTIIKSSRILCRLHKKFSDVPQGCCPDSVGCTIYMRKEARK